MINSGVNSLQRYQIIDSHGTVIDKFSTTPADILSAIAGATAVLFADGTVSAPSISFTTDTGTGFYHTGTGATGSILAAINGVQQVAITSGNVQIGTGATNPGFGQLFIAHPTAAYLFLKGGSYSEVFFGSDSAGAFVGTLNPNSFTIRTSNIARMTILSDGKVGIGITTPNSTLHVNGSVATAYRAITALRTLDATDHTIDCTANSFTVTLPTAVNIAGREYEIKNSGTGTITLATTSSQTIDASASGAITLLQWDSITVFSDGANWKIK